MAMNSFFSGIKISATYMIMAATIGEWLGGDKGLGVYMLRAKSAYALDKVFASTIIVVFISIIFVLIAEVSEKKYSYTGMRSDYMFKKRLISILASTVLTASLLSGCAGQDKKEDNKETLIYKRLRWF